MKTYLTETPELNFSHPNVQAYIADIKATESKQQVIELYYAIRDDIKYNPFTFVDGWQSLIASNATSLNETYCIPKSALMVACCRGLGIPARLGLADVKNHLATPKLLEFLRNDLFVMHGYAELFINNKWVKCTPVFNVELCEKFGILPLAFDGENDSIFHPFTQSGDKHMEYVRDHGTFDSVPIDFILQGAKAAYPHIPYENWHLA